jgi:hypothetical protein
MFPVIKTLPIESSFLQQKTEGTYALIAMGLSMGVTLLGALPVVHLEYKKIVPPQKIEWDEEGKEPLPVKIEKTELSEVLGLLVNNYKIKNLSIHLSAKELEKVLAGKEIKGEILSVITDVEGEIDHNLSKNKEILPFLNKLVSEPKFKGINLTGTIYQMLGNNGLINFTGWEEFLIAKKFILIDKYGSRIEFTPHGEGALMSYLTPVHNKRQRKLTTDGLLRYKVGDLTPPKNRRIIWNLTVLTIFTLVFAAPYFWYLIDQGTLQEMTGKEVGDHYEIYGVLIPFIAGLVIGNKVKYIGALIGTGIQYRFAEMANEKYAEDLVDVRKDYIEAGFYNMIKYILVYFFIGVAIRESVVMINKLRLKLKDQKTQERINLQGGMR